MIPANDEIRRKLENVSEGEAYYFEGYLADLIYQKESKKIVQGSSIKRTDTGNGACERLYVEKIKKIVD